LGTTAGLSSSALYHLFERASYESPPCSRRRRSQVGEAEPPGVHSQAEPGNERNHPFPGQRMGWFGGEMSLPSKDDWILKEFTELLTSSGAKPRTSCPKIFVVRCPLLGVIVGIRITVVRWSSFRPLWRPRRSPVSSRPGRSAGRRTRLCNRSHRASGAPYRKPRPRSRRHNTWP